MYNEIQKKRYIDIRNQEVILGYNYLENIFNKTQATEERIGKDVSCFTIKDMVSMAENLIETEGLQNSDGTTISAVREIGVVTLAEGFKWIKHSLYGA